MMKRNCIALILTFCLLVGSVACKNKQSPAPGAQATAAELKPLDQLLAPIALYPDALLAQVLACATSPQQVTEMNDWLQQNKHLQGTELQDAASQQGFDASFVALAVFPDVLKMMAANIDWTTEAGTAFLSDQKGVMDSVQKLRAQAQAVGNLKTTPQQEVNTESKDKQQVIVIQPANPQVVYVPQYNPQTVYSPPPATSSTTSSSSSSSDSGKTAVAALIGFGLGIAIGSAMNNDYYYGPHGWGAWGMGWHTHTVVVHGGAWVVPPHARYPYTRPVAVPYGGYHPRANVYAPTNVNVNVNRNVYAGGATPRPQPYTRATRPATTSVTRPAAMPATRPTTGQAARPATTSAARPATTQAGRSTTGPGARSAAQPATTFQRPAPSSVARTSDYGSRGYSQSASQVPSSSRTAERAQTNSSAFSGYQSGSAERAASQRGQRSASRSQGPTRGSRR